MKTLRCTIYTQKSTEDCLEQDFNSLQARREACEAYTFKTLKSEMIWRTVFQTRNDAKRPSPYISTASIIL